VVHFADTILRLGFPLPSQRTPKPQRLRVVATLKRDLAIFKLSCRRDAEQDEQDHAAGKERCDPLVHWAARLADVKLDTIRRPLLWERQPV
jgi:hypothetical protein